MERIFRYEFKKYFSLFIGLLLVFSLITPIPIHATEVDSENLDFGEIIGTFENSNDSNDVQTCALESGVISGHLSRSGNTSKVTLILSWNGSFRIKGLRFKKLTVTNGSAINTKTYATIKPSSTTYATYWSSTYSYHVYITIKVINIPTSVSKARVSVTGLQIYTDDGYWLSGILNSKNITIK